MQEVSEGHRSVTRLAQKTFCFFIQPMGHGTEFTRGSSRFGATDVSALQYDSYRPIINFICICLSLSQYQL